MASGTSFEVDLGVPYVPHYGTAPISARVVFHKVADGAGHLSDHYDLAQIYAASEGAGNGRWRLWRKTPLAESIYGTVDRPPMPEESDVKIGQLPEHHGTITDAIGKHPTKRAHALSTVLHRDYGLLVKWKALQTYILRHHLWTSKRPSPAAAMSSTSASAAAMPAAPTAIAAPSVASSSTIIEAKIGDLPR